MENKDINIKTRFSIQYLLIVIFILYFFCGCKSTPPAVKQEDLPATSNKQERKYNLTYLDSEQCNTLLSPLNLEKVEYVPDSYIIFITGTPEQLKYIDTIIDVIDSPESYCVENFGTITNKEKTPSHGQIAALLGNTEIGTFSDAPVKNDKPRVLIDEYENKLIAYVPMEYRERLFSIIKGETTPIDSQNAALAQSETKKNIQELPDDLAYSEYLKVIDSESQANESQVGIKIDSQSNIQSLSENRTDFDSTQIIALTEMADPKDIDIEEENIELTYPTQDANELPKTVTITLKPSANSPDTPATTNIMTMQQLPENAEDLLDLTLPETITPVQLLDLAGEHLGLNYVYDTKLISNQPVTLKLHGNLQGQIKVKNLYALLETVLDFMNLAMIRQQDNLVAVVPIDRALQTQPDLVDANNTTVQIGDSVVTRVFNIKYTDISSVINLLQNMKLSVAVTALEGKNLVLVTCQAGRMNRIEELINMIDQPGKTVECRFRRLYFTLAPALIGKVRTLAEKTSGTPVPKSTAIPPAPSATTIQSSTNKLSVYLDIDERTNRILMIGYEEELNHIEEIIDILDVAQTDPRSPGVYTIKYLDANKALEKLKELDIFTEPKQGNSPDQQANASSNVLSEQSLVIVLEETNQLLVRAAADQHLRIRQFLNYIDVAPDSMKELYAYELKNIKADKAMKILNDLDLAGVETLMPAMSSDPNDVSISQAIASTKSNKSSATGGPKIVLNESTNALLIKATPRQHTHIANVLKYIDKKAPEEDLTYEIYPLENSSPDYISNILDELVGQTARDEEDKIVEQDNRNQNRITIVPDPNTFSLIVYTNRTNHEWLSPLIERLDKRRPQVLIDVTLVEVTKIDTFEYDLKLVSNAQRAATGNIVLDPLQNISSGANFEAGFGLANSGETKVFYSDDKVQALLTAVQEKNYGRVLAKPKILVDDGQEGQIITTDITSYVKEQIQIPQTGNPITTRDYFPIEASIELLITPHISEGKLLRLSVNLSRDDFGTRPQSDAPPDITSSKINTTVFVPDDSTVILGGLVKLNQSKGNSKIPILGDLPFIGSLFRSIGNSDVEKKLYVFLKANIVRPYGESELEDLQEISEQHRKAFEKDESTFQDTQSFPGVKPQTMQPEHVLRDYK